MGALLRPTSQLASSVPALARSTNDPYRQELPCPPSTMFSYGLVTPVTSYVMSSNRPHTSPDHRDQRDHPGAAPHHLPVPLEKEMREDAALLAQVQRPRDGGAPLPAPSRPDEPRATPCSTTPDQDAESGTSRSAAGGM